MGNLGVPHFEGQINAYLSLFFGLNEANLTTLLCLLTKKKKYSNSCPTG